MHHRALRGRAAGGAAGLARDARGAAALEFALVAPLFFTLIFGIFDMGQVVYGKAVLDGAVQQAARDNSLESANTTAADAFVKKIVGPVLPGVTLASTRSSYYDFNDILRPEKYNDANKDGKCDNGEAYTDENGDGHWNADVGKSDNGGANDVVVYKVVATFKPLFSIPFLPNKWTTQRVSAVAVKKNQPFAYQASYGNAAGTCP
ncbi:TadE/TadG family type IV pilus assembly protein [Novosphingobium lentum]|uniref:TadE/TadG family type IV pilus assembly protein n=1 Tax=Novosphingobium lentum TaxID=145287 RepID=UPI001FE0DF82|nr:TadE family protein [Novosphingobium lentum]